MSAIVQPVSVLCHQEIAIDVGYGYTKAISDFGGKVCFPSIIAPATADLLGGIFADNLGHRVKIDYGNGSTEKLIGEAAIRSLAATTMGSRHKSPGMHDTLILAAAYMAGAGGINPSQGQIDLAVGLPLAYYRAQKEALAIRLKQLEAWVSVDNGPERNISFNKIAIFPQGIGAVLVYPKLLPSEGLVGVIDIGQYTTDYLLIECLPGTSQPRPIMDGCGSDEVGIHLVHRSVAQEFQLQTGAPLPAEMREQAVRARAVFFDGKNINLSTTTERALSDAAQAITQKVIGAWGKRSSHVRTILLCGGGAVLLREHLAKHLPIITEVPDPTYANAMGYLRALTARTSKAGANDKTKH
ncbi:MAG: hypothetical protein DDT32_01151 [Syntrophomonadaceae bacterium]|nr:hypothetical protein [Bacillota bacterium]